MEVWLQNLWLQWARQRTVPKIASWWSCSCTSRRSSKSISPTQCAAKTLRSEAKLHRSFLHRSQLWWTKTPDLNPSYLQGTRFSFYGKSPMRPERRLPCFDALALSVEIFPLSGRTACRTSGRPTRRPLRWVTESGSKCHLHKRAFVQPYYICFLEVHRGSLIFYNSCTFWRN